MGKSSAILLSLAVIILCSIGVVILASTGVWDEAPDQEYRYLTRQVVLLGVGLLAAGFFAVMDYRLIQKFWVPLAIISTVLLICCYIPGIQVESNGETRWIKFPFIGRFQPSELAKLSTMVSVAAWYCRHQAERHTFWKGFVMPGILVGVPIVLVLFETDMGTAAAMAAASLLVLFLAGTRLLFLIPTVILGCGGMYYVVTENENRMERITAFQDLYEHRLGRGLQQYRALLAFGNGGVEGVGLGNGSEKHGYLPEAHTDFIFPMIGEELGLRVTLVVVLCFVIISVFGVAIGLSAPDLFGKVLGIGITSMIIVPAIMNMAVTTASIPNTGLPLPFVSYGGSNLIFTLSMVGILLGIQRRSALLRREELPLIKKKRVEVRI